MMMPYPYGSRSAMSDSRFSSGGRGDPRCSRGPFMKTKTNKTSRGVEKRIRLTRHVPLPVTAPLPQRLQHFIESLTVSQGYRVGEFLKLFQWQKDFNGEVFSRESGDAALSLARGRGEDYVWVSSICSAAIAGPLAQPSW